LSTLWERRVELRDRRIAAQEIARAERAHLVAAE
jgi:hypothetical protein